MNGTKIIFLMFYKLIILSLIHSFPFWDYLFSLRLIKCVRTRDSYNSVFPDCLVYRWGALLDGPLIKFSSAELITILFWATRFSSVWMARWGRLALSSWNQKQALPFTICFSYYLLISISTLPQDSTHQYAATTTTEIKSVTNYIDYWLLLCFTHYCYMMIWTTLCYCDGVMAMLSLDSGYVHVDILCVFSGGP